MAKTDLTIPALGNKFIDYRDLLPGDSYNWSWERDLSQVNYLAIHHSGGPDTETPENIANAHITNNGWGGIGYHFLIAKDGTVFYVGDIGTARANVANLNEQVIGICLVGNFTQGRLPSNEQLDSTHKLCEFFILNFPDLTGVKSWDKVRGHNELPNQSTNCPGETFSTWRTQIVEGVTTAEEIREISVEDDKKVQGLKSQIDSLQTSLASLNQQVFFLQEALVERDRLINQLRSQPTSGNPQDTTLTIVDALINLYRFVFPPGKEI